MTGALAAFMVGLAAWAHRQNRTTDDEIRRSVARADLTALDQATHAELMGLYPEVGENEGWYGAGEAYSRLKYKPPTHD